MSGDRKLDYMYAVANTELLLVPKKHLETFDNTLLHYHHVSEDMDRVGSIKVRTGKMQINRPQILTPGAYSKIVLEGFGEEAEKYAQWLQDHDDEMRILRYGYCLKTDNFSEQIVTDSLAAVTERVKAAVVASNDAFAAVLQGVDDPWDVAIVELWRKEVERSADRNIRELGESGKLFG